MVRPVPRLVAVVVAAVFALFLAATPAAAHNGHEALPGGFQARLASFVDAAGNDVQLEGVRLRVEPGGIGLTAENTTDAVLEVTGEQAGEPLLRVTASQVEVNQASPQAASVKGATVDPSKAAQLIDLVWKRAPADWVVVPGAGSAFVLDHRGAPGHAPVRSQYETGDNVDTFGVDFTYDGEAYRAQGQIVAVALPSSPTGRYVAIGVAALALVLLAVVGLTRRRATSKGRSAPAGTLGADGRSAAPHTTGPRGRGGAPVPGGSAVNDVART